MIKLRPHHLFCTQGYSGKGYSDEFVKNMDNVVECIKKPGTKIEIVFTTDDICSKCPNMLGINICETNDKVINIDNKVIKYFNIKEDVYTYEEIVDYIKKNITEDIMNDICGSCKWYAISNCKNEMLNKGIF